MQIRSIFTQPKREALMKSFSFLPSGMVKPPVAPKPKLTLPQKPGLSPAATRRDDLSLPSPGTQRRVKPVLAPKPCLSKLSPAVESKQPAAKSPHQTCVRETPLRTEGLLNSQNGIQQENKKPDWDYIIPICLCSDENCSCIRNTTVNEVEKDFKKFHKGKTEGNQKLLTTSHGSVDNSGEKMDMCQVVNTNSKQLKEKFTLDRNLNTVTLRPTLPHRTWSDEANGNVTPQSTARRGPEDDALGSEHTPRTPQLKAASRKPGPVPLPRKPRITVLTCQEKVEDEREESQSQEGRDIKVSSPSLGEPVDNKQTVFLSASRPYTAPAPPPRKKPFLSTPEKALTPAPLKLSEDVEEEDLGWDSSVQEMEVSVDKEDEELEKEKEVMHQETADYSHSLLHQPMSVSAEDLMVKVAPKKPKRHSCPTAWKQTKESTEEKVDEDETRQTDDLQDPALKERSTRKLPPTPNDEMLRHLPEKSQTIQPARPSVGKQRAKSFSSADLPRSDGQKRNSFRKLLDLKLSVKKLIVKRAQSPTGENEQSVDKEPEDSHEHFRAERKYSCPLFGVEQSVDGDIYYENIPHYEEIPDYMNVETDLTSLHVTQTTSAWQSSMYNDEGIYEEQEPYMSFEKNSGQQQHVKSAEYERYMVSFLSLSNSSSAFFLSVSFMSLLLFIKISLMTGRLRS